MPRLHAEQDEYDKPELRSEGGLTLAERRELELLRTERQAWVAREEVLGDTGVVQLDGNGRSELCSTRS